jgi:glycerate dehydrogenase
MMKPTAFLIDTSRGPLIDEHSLAEALNRGWIAGAGLDVLCDEPPRHDNPLLHAKNYTITPHIAGATKAARQRLMDIAVSNIRAFIQGNPQNVVTRRQVNETARTRSDEQSLSLVLGRPAG